MTWIRLRSRRDPAVWLPVLIVLVCLTAVAAWAQIWISSWLESITEMASSDPDRAVSEAVQFIRLCELALCAISLLFAGFLCAFFRRSSREGRLPPSGWWSFGAWRMLVGPAARRQSQVGLALAAVLPLLTAATVVLIEILLRTLLDGRPAA